MTSTRRTTTHPAPRQRDGDTPSTARAGTAPAPDVHAVLHSRGYLLLLVAAAVLALPVSALAFGFLAGVQWLQRLVWEDLPGQLGWSTPPAWWPLPVLALAGLVVGAAIRGLPGRGGHVPAEGLAGGLTEPRTLAGVVLAALASLSLGAVIGPEAPLIAIGGGLALLAADRTKLGADAQGRALIAAAGSAAAIATILGNPLVAVILMLEIVGLASRSVMLVIVPCIISSGVGALLFTGLGHWTGLPTGSLALPDISATTLDAADLLLVIPLAAAVAVLMHAVDGPRAAGGHHRGAPSHPRRGRRRCPDRRRWPGCSRWSPVGRRSRCWGPGSSRCPDWSTRRGRSGSYCSCCCARAWRTGCAWARSVAVRPSRPSSSAGCVGVLAGHLPGLGTVPGLGICMAAGMVAILRLPVTSVLLIVLILGPAATSQMPVVMIATVTALVVVETLDRRRAPTGDAHPAATGPTSQADTATG